MNMSDLHRLGKTAAAQMGEGPGDDRIAAQREAFLASLDTPRPPQRRRLLAPALAGAALSFLVLGVGWLLWPRATGRPTAPEEGMVLTARATPLVMELDGGNQARLAPDSVGQLAVSTPEEVKVVLVHGELTSTIRTPTRWSVQAGPYSVEAAGTEYVVVWKDARLDVRVQSGRVRVRGQDAPGAGWLVEAGEQLTIDRGRLIQKGGDKRPVTAPPTTETPPTPSPDPPPTPAVDPPQVAVTPPLEAPREADAGAMNPPGDVPSPAPDRSPTTRPGSVVKEPAPEAPSPWREMLRREEYGPAVSFIEKSGLSDFADHARLQDLQAMANAARYAGRGQTAVVLLVSLRTRFPGTAQAATAAFLMGRVYSEQMRDQRAAVSWFSTYLAEVPSGSLVEEALGRKMDAAQRAGMTNEARLSATKLLERYPASPFRPLALQILGTNK